MGMDKPELTGDPQPGSRPGGGPLPLAYLLVDCNNFFVSCERLFRPDLRQRPVLVMSNNDGCVIARSQEVKDLGVPMGVAVFKIRDLIREHRIACFSSNFPLYLDISNRIMRTLGGMFEQVMPYSVDEAFVALRGMGAETALEQAGRARATIQSEIGIPVGIGIARTKTLAKLANHHAKTHRHETFGVYSALSEEHRLRILRENPIKEIWGVGRRMEEHLTADGIHSAYQLSLASPERMQRKYSINIARTIEELNGIEAVADVDAAADQQQIMWSRTFKDRLTHRADLAEAVANYAATAAVRLRAQGLYCRRVSVTINTSFFGAGPKYQNCASLELDYPTKDSRSIVAAAGQILGAIFREGFRYMRAGVILSELSRTRAFAPGLFVDLPSDDELRRGEQLMEIMDLINRSRSNTIYLGQQMGLTSGRQFTDRAALSQGYTSSFAELPRAR
ncbi:MAG: Y-family DNA polymerase [Succinivibrionaceae bacterium]|nr:Y-family DNA polymerase [Succinivibrionaceae bacterium]